MILHVETPWDYNVTEEEQEVLTFHSKKLYEKLGESSANLGLYLLFSYRGQKEKAAVYFKRLPEDVQRPILMQDEFEF